MKKLGLIVSVCLAAVFASCEEQGPLYTATYSVVRIQSEAAADLPQQAGADTIILHDIKEDVLLKAPVRAGGSYTLDYDRIDEGSLSVRVRPDAWPLPGTFFKTLGDGNLQFVFSDQNYTCTIESYVDESGTNRVLFLVDLTKYYQELLPEWGITSVTRKEYTSFPYK